MSSTLLTPMPCAASVLDPAAVAVAEANRTYDRGDHICAQALDEAAREGVSAEMHSADGHPADVLISIAESAEGRPCGGWEPRHERSHAHLARECFQQVGPSLSVQSAYRQH